MTVKLSRYIFRKINGRIIPIRKGIKEAEKIVSKLADEVLNAKRSVKTGEPSKKALVGRGVDFNVFGLKSTMVMKVPRNTVGTANKTLIKHFPELGDKIAVSKAASDNLPNYGIPTLEQKVVRIKGKLKAIVQNKVEMQGEYKNHYYLREVEKLQKDSGLHLDAHFNNWSKNTEMIDTGLNLKKVNLATLKRNDTAREILGLENYYGTQLKHAGKPEELTEQALEYGHSRKALKKLNALLKSGKVKLNKNMELRKIPEVSSTDQMNDFMKKTGNIRVHSSGDDLNFDTFTEPTIHQLGALDEMASVRKNIYYDSPKKSGEAYSIKDALKNLIGLKEAPKTKIADTLENKAIEEFGKTYNHETAGFITREGDFLDFSGGRGSGGIRGLDHRSIAEIMPEPPLKKITDKEMNKIVGEVVRDAKNRRNALHSANNIYQDILKWKAVKKGDPLYEIRNDEIKHLHGLLKGEKFQMRYSNVKNADKFLKKLKGK